jgi:serine/threonine protein kinase
MAEATPLAPGAVLGGRYRLLELIGSGGMATVWLAEDRTLDRRVAIKALSETLLVDPAYVARFEREARIAAGLLHPNLVKVFDYGSGEERPYLVMEHVEGPTLAALIAGEGAHRDPDRLAAELLGALERIHSAGVVHRDVKPSNVLTDRRGSAKLTDFGIARPADATQLTQTGHVIGTLAYMAPEVKEGGVADQRSDLYSAGVVLREAAKGELSPPLAALIERLTAAPPAERPASAAAALELLDGPTAATEPLEPTAPLPAGAELGAGGAGAAGAGEGLGGLAPPRRRAILALALAAAAGALLLFLLGSDDGGSPATSTGAKRDSGAAKTTPTPEQPKQPTTASPAPPAPPAPAAKSPQPSPPPTDCDQIAEQRKAIEEQGKGAAKAAGGDKEKQKALKEVARQQSEALKEQEKQCREAEK